MNAATIEQKTEQVQKIQSSGHVLQDITDFGSLSKALSQLGYPIILTDKPNDSITISLEVRDNNYPLLLDINKEQKTLRLEVQVGAISDLPESDPQSLASAALTLLSLNSYIAPFAINVYQPEENDTTANSPITLLDEIPLGHFFIKELESSIMSCRKAIILVAASLATLK